MRRLASLWSVIQYREYAAQRRALGRLHLVRFDGCVTRWDSRRECFYLVEEWTVGSGERHYTGWRVTLSPEGRVVGVE